MRNLIIDLETSGFPKKNLPRDHEDQPRVVELGLILRDGTEVMSEFGGLVRVPDGFEMPEGAYDAHKITPEMCNGFGVGPTTAGKMAIWFLNLAEVAVAFSMTFDFEMLRVLGAQIGQEREMEAALSRPSHFCAMKRATNHCKIPAKNGKGYKDPNLKEAVETLIDPDLLKWTLGHRPAHRGLADACRAMLIYDEITKRETVQM